MTFCWAISCTGCSSLIGSPPTTTTTTTVGAPYYHAYGDSITAGYTLPSPTTQEYAALIAAQLSLPLTDHALIADQACDVPTRQIFPNSDDPVTNPALLYTLLIGTNDADGKGPGAYEAIYNLCQQASIAWLALPLSFKVLANAATVTTSGAGHLDATNNWNAWVTDAVNSSITFPIQLTADGPVYLWYRILDGSSGAFTYTLDGELAGSGTSATNPSIATLNGSNNSLALLRLPGVTAGAHTLTLTQTSTGLAGLGVVAVGLPPASVRATLPLVLVGTIPPQLIGSPAVCAVTPASCQAYTADAAANVALLYGDGLRVELFTSGKYLSATSADMSDNLHPNALGHTEIAHAITDILN